MNAHSRAKTNPRSRELIVQRVQAEGWSRREAAEALGLSVRSVAKWLRRYREEGLAGLPDRTSRPRSSPMRTSEVLRKRVLELRQKRLVGREIAETIGLPRATVSRILRQAGVGRLRSLEPPEPPNRYEHAHPGDLLHIDIKKLARIVGGPGHRIHGDRRKKKRGVGYEHFFVCIDDHSRLSYVEALKAENMATATGFLERAIAWYRASGIQPRRLLTDNGRVFTSRPFNEVLAQASIRHGFTRPYRPRTNGKAERFIQTMLREWAYRRSYSSSAKRRRALPRWLHYYNFHRQHSSLGGKPPVSRVNNLFSRDT
ncbi:MAG: IS481 family transposase [Acidobacteria bacterium]|nr:IS481 family transposase [Acidobacteriota bacterium]